MCGVICNTETGNANKRLGCLSGVQMPHLLGPRCKFEGVVRLFCLAGGGRDRAHHSNPSAIASQASLHQQITSTGDSQAWPHIPHYAPTVEAMNCTL